MKINHDKIAERLRSGRAGAPKGSATAAAVDHDKIAQRLRSGRAGAPKGSATAGAIDHDKIARLLGAERRGRLEAGSGPFAAAALALNMAERLRSPAGGGQPTDPSWNERRLVAMKRGTLEKLEQIAAAVREKTGTNVQPLQIAAAVIEKFAGDLDVDEVSSILKGERQAG
jgi:hypothetical protein